jgi:hypothetical protein
MALTARLLISFPLLWIALAGQQHVTFGSDGADVVFRQSRAALGGEAALTSVASLVMKGTARVPAGDDGPPDRTLEIRIQLPDQYVRIETAKDWSRRSGFSGDTLLTQVTRSGVAQTPPANLSAALLRGEKWRLARLLLGTASLATPEVWLTIRQAPAAFQLGETGHVLEAASRDDFLARIFYDAAGIPARVEADVNRRRIATSFKDRRKAGGLMLPHTITTTLDGMPVEELALSEIIVNAPLTAADFER